MPKKIIDTRSQMSLINKVFHTSLAIAIWSIALAFIARLLTAVIWYFLAITFKTELMIPTAYIDVIVFIRYLLLFSLAIFFLNYLWANYNYQRYGKLNRRAHQRLRLDNKLLAAIANLPAAKLYEMQRVKYYFL